MTRYFKKPEEVQAIQWTGENTKEVIAFGPWAHAWVRQQFAAGLPNFELVFDEPDKDHAKVGDYIVRDEYGDAKVIPQQRFEDSYAAEASAA